MKVGNKIKKMRELREYTQDDMADKLAMSQSGYSKIELDETDVPFSRLLQISKVLEVSLSDLVNFDEAKILLNNNTLHEQSQGFVFVTCSHLPQKKQSLDKIINFLENPYRFR